MAFSIDKQTLDELNLLGKFRKDSVYHLFNRVRTRGGEQLLDNMFRHPLTNAAEINQRSAVFRFFQESQLEFPFDVQQVSLMREYLDAQGINNAALVFAGTLAKKWLAAITRDERYKKNVQGLQATIITLNRCHAFLAAIPRTNHPYEKRISEISGLLEDKRIGRLSNIDIYKDLPVKTIAYYNHLLKAILRREMEDILSFISELDACIAVSDVARSRHFSYATATDDTRNILSAEDLRHPCIEGAVGNYIALGKNSNVMFLTGANMAGKSTLMKSIGTGLYLAHMGFPVAAVNMLFSVREGMYSSINVSDNIGLGYSHFYAEVVRVKQAAQAAAAGKKLLLMFDELFKGTNVKDAYDGTLAVTEGFADYHDCLFVISTHIVEVGVALQGHPNIRFVYMPTVMEGPYPRYTYRLQEGITEDRQGMMIIRNEGILELLNKHS